jgi:hypothetical protein
MKKITSILASLSLACIGVAAPAVPAAAMQAPVAYCEAKSPSATGWATRYNMNEACNVALYECAVRTPSTQTCYVVRSYWYNAS